MNARTICAYCKQPRDFSTGWHTCSEARDAQARLNVALNGIIGTQQDRKPKFITK